MGNSTSQDAGKPSVVSVLGAKTVIPTVRVFCCLTPILTSEECMVSCIPCVDQRITGRLCDGEGCKVVYHKECLNPPLQTVPAGEWYCPGCEKGKVGKIWSVRKACSVVRSMADARSSDATGSGNLHGDQHNSEDEAQNDVPLGARFGSSSQHPEGAVNETGLVSGSCANVVNTNLKDGSVEYLVQWKSRSHAHDKWVNEKELEKLAPKELARFKKLLHEGQLYHAQEKYDAEWTEPERIIQKRLTRVTRRRPDSPVEKGKISNIQNAEIEWFVKWKGLGYEHCTWEPANAGVLASSRGIELINESEGWKNAAMQRARKESQEEAEKRVKLPPWCCGVYGGGFGGVVSWESVVMWEFAAASYVPVEPMQAGEELREEPVNRGGRKMTAKEEDEARWAVAKMFFEHRILVENQLQSYNEFLETGMQRMFKEGDFKTN